jgi:hypothetical protein
MANFSLTVTNVGNSALASVTAGGSFNITSVQFGSGQIGSGNPAALTALISPQYSETIPNGNTLIQFQTSIQFILAESAIPVSFSNYEVGVFGSVNGGTPILFAYGYTTTPDNLTQGGGQTFDYVLGIKYSQAANVTVSLVNTISVPLHANTHISLNAGTGSNGIDQIPPATTSSTGLVPISTGTGAKVLTDTGTVSWQALPAQNIGSPILVNGDFSVQSRPDGTLGGSISGGAAYLTDNWYLNSSASIAHVSASWNQWDNSFTPDAVYKTPKGFIRFASNQAVSTSSFLDLTTYIEANDLDTAIGYACVPSALIRSSAGNSLLMYCQSGDGTYLFGNLVTLTSSWQRFSFSLPSSWPASSHFNRSTIADLVKLGLSFSFRIISTSSGAVPSSNNTWTTSTTSGSAWNPFTGSSSTIDFADARFDANCTSVQNPIFEPQQNTYDRCLRLYEPDITYVGTINNIVGSTTTSIGSGNYRVAKRILPKNFTSSSGLGNGALQILGQDSGRTITAIGTGGNLVGFNQIQAGGYASDLGYGCYVLIGADSSF